MANLLNFIFFMQLKLVSQVGRHAAGVVGSCGITPNVALCTRCILTCNKAHAFFIFLSRLKMSSVRWRVRARHDKAAFIRTPEYSFRSLYSAADDTRQVLFYPTIQFRICVGAEKFY